VKADIVFKPKQTMRILICAVAVLVSFPLQCVLGVSPEEETNFLTAVRQAYDQQDTNALFTLICWDRVPDKFVQRAKSVSLREITRKVSDMTLVNFPQDRHVVPLKDTNGVAYLPNLPVIKELKIIFVVDGHTQSGSHPVGEKDGKLYLLENAPVESGQPGDSDKHNSAEALRLQKVLIPDK
jgi:hypothetical protein